MQPKLIICGMEHTGTTLVSDLFRQVPSLDSGFECGVLLRSSPDEFRSLEPFSQNMLKGWGITKKQFDECCDAKTYDQFYSRLFAASTVLPEGTTHIFDKTPRYLSELSSILGRTSAPVVVCYKDPRAIVCSDFKRAKTDNFFEWYGNYMPKKRNYMSSCYSEFIQNREHEKFCSVGLEELAMDARRAMERIFLHVGEEFKVEYAIMKDVRYKNTRNNTVSADIAFEYAKVLKRDWIVEVEKDFASFSEWFYE